MFSGTAPLHVFACGSDAATSPQHLRRHRGRVGAQRHRGRRDRRSSSEWSDAISLFPTVNQDVGLTAAAFGFGPH